MALSIPYNQPRFDSCRTSKLGTIAASVLLPLGTLVMNDAGQAKPFTTAGYLAGARLLGYANQTYDNSASGSIAVLDMMFLRDCPMILSGLGGDLPTTTHVGGPVALHDNFTCKKTIAAGEATGILLEVLPNNRFLVWIP